MKGRAHIPKPARPDDSPFALLTRGLDARLRAEAPSSFAGMARKPDGVFEVYATVADPAFLAVVEAVRTESGYQGALRVVPGMKNSLLSLEAVFARVRARAEEFHRDGIVLVQFGVDILANRVGLGVEGLTPEIAAALRREFGPDRVKVFEGQRFRPLSARAAR